MSKRELRYWDSSVFLADIAAEKNRAEICEAIIKMARDGECLICTSAITLAEVIRPRQKGKIVLTEKHKNEIAAFFKNPFIRFVDFSAPLGESARDLQWNYGLKVRDAVHVSCAIAAKADVIETYDGDFLKVNPEDVSGCPEIRKPIAEPNPLFDQEELEREEDGL